jgi:hypothetical protein
MRIEMDGGAVGTIAGQRELGAGQRFHLPDGSSLEVQLKRTFLSTDLRVSRNGIPLPGSAGDPATGWKNAFGLMYFIGGLNILIGLLAMFGMAFLLDLGIGLYNLVFGLVFVILAYAVHQFDSVLALWLGFLALIADAILGIAGNIMLGSTPSVAGILVRILLIGVLFQGIGAMRAMKANQASPEFQKISR